MHVMTVLPTRVMIDDQVILVSISEILLHNPTFVLLARLRQSNENREIVLIEETRSRQLYEYL